MLFVSRCADPAKLCAGRRGQVLQAPLMIRNPSHRLARRRRCRGRAARPSWNREAPCGAEDSLCSTALRPCESESGLERRRPTARGLGGFAVAAGMVVPRLIGRRGGPHPFLSAALGGDTDVPADLSSCSSAKTGRYGPVADCYFEIPIKKIPIRFVKNLRWM